LDDHVQHFAFVISRPPEIPALTADVHHHLIQMPARARRRTAPLQIASNLRAELDRPATDGLITDVDAALRQQFFDVAKVRCEAEIEPNPVADNIGRKPMPLKREPGDKTASNDPLTHRK
jgi:hypothetical protein